MLAAAGVLFGSVSVGIACPGLSALELMIAYYSQTSEHLKGFLIPAELRYT
jgi:hypothetical protein